ncbi:MAG: aryl-sulfate sulfotransferase [Haloferacaceae archaeon]
MTARRAVLRATLAALVLASAGTLALGWGATPSDVPADANHTGPPLSEREQVVAERNGVTVLTTDPPGGTEGAAALVAFTPDGRVLYRNDTFGNYFDVDPDPPGSRTVLYVAGSRYGRCPAALAARANRTFDDGCAEVAVERVNLSTGATERVHTTVTDGDIWHDVDRVGPHRLLVADIAADRVFVLDTRTGAVGWEWRAAGALDPDSGGRPGDWTHLNDVERLADGRVMASLRNQDRVAFVDPGTGLLGNRTLGAEDAYGVLYEQHNPDYIPAERGGPAVVVADSENNRVVEYRYAGGRWRRVWTWRDGELRWPRDADRLPGGHTLVTDSQGNRVIELDEHGEVVWRVDVRTPYEAERLGTGDESATGRSRAAPTGGGTRSAGAGTGAAPADGGRATGAERVVAFLGGPAVNGLLYAAPAWVTVRDLVAALLLCGAALVWGALELYWCRVDPGAAGGAADRSGGP